MSWRRLGDVLETFWKGMIKTNIITLIKTYAFRRRIQDFFKTSQWRRIHSSWVYIFKTSSRHFEEVFKTFSRRFEDVFKTFSRCLAKTSARRPAKTSWRHLQSVFKMSWKDISKTSSRLFQEVSSSLIVLVHTSSRCLWDALNTFLRRSRSRSRTRSHFLENFDQDRNFPRVHFFDIPKRLKELFRKTLYEITASTNKDTIVKVEYQKRCCC